MGIRSNSPCLPQASSPFLTPPHVALLGLVVCLLGMVFLGGMTRLTGSGLFIVQWDLVTGILPPVSSAAWNALFEAYQHTPEFRHVNPLCTLDDFKNIFWLEYLHRLMGRLLGLVLLVPTVLLWRLPSARWRLLSLWGVGGLQGGVGWWMVKSGLMDQPWVSPWRLTLHFLLAVLLFTLAWDLYLKQTLEPSASRMPLGVRRGGGSSGGSC